MTNTFTILQESSHYTFFWQPEPDPGHAPAGGYGLWASTHLRPHQHAELQAAIDSAAQTGNSLRPTFGDALPPFLRLGRLLFNYLLPPALQDAIRRLPPGSPLAIASNDTELPWELLHDDQDFLALRHLVSRRLLTAGPGHAAGNTSAPDPPRQFPAAARPLRCLLIGNPNGDLPAADAEVETLLDLLETAPQPVRVEFLCREHAAKVRVLAALAGGEYDLIHFACHAVPGALQLADGRLDAVEIQAVLRGRPLVAVNACSSGRTPGPAAAAGRNSSSDTRSDTGSSPVLHSLAHAFLVGGAPVFLGTAWPVDDTGTRRVIVEFYRELLAGLPLAAALRQARLAGRRLAAAPDGGSHAWAWAAPVLYGDPGYRLPLPPVQCQPGTLLSVRLTDPGATETAPPMVSLDGNALPAPSSLAGAPLEAEALAARAQMDRIIAIARSYRGEVIALEHGFLRVLFGVPVPLEDDAARAVAAALAIRGLYATPPPGATAPGHAPPPACTIAVTSGEVITTAPPAATAGPLLHSGPPFTAAAALLAGAQPGQVLADERARQLAQGRFAFLPRLLDDAGGTRLCYEPAARGAYAEDLPADPAAAALSAPGAPSPYPGSRLLGRARELEQLAAWRLEAARGRGQVIGIVGEAGVGKTRLLGEFQQTLAPFGGTWIGLACASPDRDTPYALAAQFLRRVFDILPADDAAAAAAKIDARLAALAPGAGADPQLNQILRDTLGLSTSYVDENERKARRGRLVHLLRTMMADAAQQQPLTIAIDDLHWADAASFELLSQVTDGIHRLGVQFVVLYRPEFAHPWFDKPYYRHLALDGLDLAAAHDLLHVLLGSEELPKGLDVLLQKTGGNPFFIEEMLKSLQESGLLVRQPPGAGPAWALQGRLTEQQLPATVERTLRVRLAALTPSTRAVLEPAAVIGPVFSLALLRAALADMPPDTLDAALAELEQRGFVEASWDAAEYRFRHALILDAVGQIMPPGQYQAWHRRIADLLTGEIERLAHHLYHSLLVSRPAEPPQPDPRSSPQQAGRAVACLLACGARSLLRSAPRAAITYFERALLLIPLLSDPPAAISAADAADATGCATDADGADGATGDPFVTDPLALPEITAYIAAVRCRGGIGDAHTLLGSFAAAARELRAAYSALHLQPLSPPARRHAADLTRRIGRACAWQGEHARGLAWMEEGLRVLGSPQTDDDRAVAAFLYVHKGSVEYNRGRLAGVARDCAAGLLLAREVGRLLPAEAEAHNMLGIIAWAQGRLAEAIDEYGRSRTAWQALGNGYQVARVEGNLGVALFYLGRWDEARDLHTRALEYWERVEDRDMLAHPCLNLGNICLCQGDWDAAARYFQRALALWSSARHARFMSLCHTNLGLLAIEQAQWAQAQAQLEESRGILSAADIGDLVSEVLAALAEVALGLGDLPRAAELAESAREAAAALGMQHEEALALRVRGRIRLAAGDLPAARTDLAAALASFTAMANRYEAARTQVHLACVELAAGCTPAAATVLDAAAAVFAALGARHDLRKAQELAGELPDPLSDPLPDPLPGT